MQKSWKFIDSPAWYTSRADIFFFFFFLKRNDLLVAIFFSRAITFCVHDIFEKKEKCKSLSTDDTFDPSIFFFYKKKIKCKMIRLFKKKNSIYLSNGFYLTRSNKRRDNTRTLGIGICFNLFRRFKKLEELIGNTSKFDKVLDQETRPQWHRYAWQWVRLSPVSR